MKDTANQPINSFYVKTMGNMARAGSALEWKPVVELSEIFVYQLFKLIGIGASEVHIIPGVTNSECVYLATKISENQF